MPRSVHSLRFARPLFLFLLLNLGTQLHAIGQPRYVEDKCSPGCFTLASGKSLATIIVDPKDYPGVIRAAGDLQADVARVTGQTPKLVHAPAAVPAAIIVGTIGRSAVIKDLIRTKKLDVSNIAGSWESFFLQVVEHPMKGISRALVITGSDKRGAIYGIYDLSEQIGVSPWYWWADVPVRHRDSIFVKTGKFTQGEPAVKYRGIFLNDEAPSLTGWVKEKFGGYNHEFYVKVFELMLRMKGNYLWPAMWGSAFNEDDPLNPKLADEYGIVMGTSHHEPMLRAQQEWKRHGIGPWDYSKNSDVLQRLWADGVERNRNYESIVTVGMRGDGDMPMSKNAEVELLERIVADQRIIIASHVNPEVTSVPQVWALYKEVQEYYEKGMRVPDDVTLLWSDDNWGNIRRLPTPEERKRKGGAGVYYHFDYVGGPRNYKWLNTVPTAKVWEQMNLAYQYGATRIWIANVGDLKPMEFPIEFFLSLAWNPQRWPKESVGEYTRLWAEREFGSQYASQIADIVSKYTKYNGRRKPELLEPSTYSLTDYREADRVAAEFVEISNQAEDIYGKLPENERDAFFQLVLYPTKASAQVAQLYIAAAKNQLYATQGRVSANDWAERTRALFREHAELSRYYNHTLANGKWKHMMDQTHLGYTWWQEPPVDKMPSVTEVLPREDANMGLALEGSAFGGFFRPPALPRFDVFNQQRYYIDVFNCGRVPFDFTATLSAPWIQLSSTHGTVSDKDERLWDSVDWTKVPRGSSEGTITITGPNQFSAAINVVASNPTEPTKDSLRGFVEANGYVSIEAIHYTSKMDSSSARWEKIDDLGRTLASMSIFPVTAPSVNPPRDSPRLEYQMYLFTPGELEVEAILAPTQNFVPGRGLRYAISWDDQPPEVIDALEHNALHDWEETVKDSVRKVKTKCTVTGAGHHTLKFWMVDPGVVLQKLVVNTGGVKPSYLGPPESYFRASTDH
jgi:hypothetical protein